VPWGRQSRWPTLAKVRQGEQDLVIRLTILRGGQVAFAGETSTAKIHRNLGELAAWLGRYNEFPYGCVLLTGTGIVPGDDFSLEDGDEVSIAIQGIGVLRNRVKQLQVEG
jgi:2-dehydro-3-deoxy-D-arabinonate dehydratase